MEKGQLSKYDLMRENNSENGLKIQPFDSEKSLKAASYDLTPSIIAMSAKTGMLENVYREKRYCDDSYYIYVHPKDTVLIISNEYLTVPPNIAGYVSSRVSKVVEGFGHISTTIDPNWSGAALIAISNPSNQMLKIYVGTNKKSPYQLATVTFHYLHTSCNSEDIEHHQTGMRMDLLQNICYKNRHGFRALLRKVFYIHRRAFTDYFFDYCKIIEQNWTLDIWDQFIKEFSTPKPIAPPAEDLPQKSKKAQKNACYFIITENFFNRTFHCAAKHKPAFFILCMAIYLILYKLELLPDSIANALSELFQML